jgi:hypothetical protein
MRTFGKLTDGSTSITTSSNYVVVSSATPDASGKLESLVARLWVSAGSYAARGVIYADNNGVPGTLLAFTDEVTISNLSEQAITFPFSGVNQIRVTEGAPYWIGLHCADPGAGNIQISKDNNANQRYEISGISYTNGPPLFFTGPSQFSGKIDAYVNYDEDTGNLNTISGEIKSLLEAVQVAGSSAFTEVVEYPTNQFNGYPAASITPSEVQSDFITVAQNQRAYGFMAELFVSLDQESWPTAFTNMRDLVDAVLDKLDQSIDLNGKCDFLRAVPMEWTIQEAGQGLVLAVALHLVAVKDVDVK